MTTYTFKPDLALETDLFIKKYIESIESVDKSYKEEARDYCDKLAVPPGALGQVAEVYQRLYEIGKGSVQVDKPGVLVYVSDNGVVQAGVSNNPVITTYQVAENMLEGKATISLLTKHSNSDLEIVDLGCLTDLSSGTTYKISHGTKNFNEDPAMTREQAGQAIIAGIKITEKQIEKGWNIVGTGEMGVGNTTTSAAVISTILGTDIKETIGLGAGLDKAGRMRKEQVITEGALKHQPFRDGLDIASKIGGYDILGIAGTFLACAKHKIPCVIDGVISMAGMLVAQTIEPKIIDIAFASHISMEPGYQKALTHTKLQPLFYLDMRLGEGSGCPFLFQFMETAKFTIENMVDFDKAGLTVDDYVDIRVEN